MSAKDQDKNELTELKNNNAEHHNELQQIRDELAILNKHKFVKALNSTPRMIWLQFFRGIAFGLGSVVGATIVVSILVAILAQIEFIPIIGEWTHAILNEIQTVNN